MSKLAPIKEAYRHGFDEYELTVRGVLFLMLKFGMYKYSNEMPLVYVDNYIADYGYETWNRNVAKCSKM